MDASLGENKTFLQKNWHWIALVAILLSIALFRIRLLSFPLERDEGEYAFAGQQILNGIPPFKETWNMKFPGTYYVYAVILAIFGQTAESIHVGLMLVNLLTTVLLFLLARKISGNLSAVVTALFWAFISFSPGVYGFAAHATHFVTVFAVAGFLLLYKSADEKKSGLFIWAGVLFGLSMLMKQSGFFFFLMGITWLGLIGVKEKKLNLPELLKLTAGFLVPPILLSLYFLATGVFSNFWFWTIVYASEYGSLVDISSGANNLWTNSKWVLEGFNSFWIFSLPGFVAIFFLKGEKQNFNKAFVLCFLISGIATIIPGFYFRPHYFITLIPAISLCVGILFQVAWENLPPTLNSNLKTALFSFLLLLVTGVSIAQNIPYFFTKSPEMLCRQDIYSGDIFADSKAIANFIRTQTGENDKILVFGSEPQILFYAQRPSAVGYIYTYPMMEIQPFALKMQKEYTKKVQEVLPKYIIYITAPGSWARNPKSYSHIFDWSTGFMEKYYKQVGLAEIYFDRTVYYWDEDADGRQAKTQDAAMIMEMKY